MKLVRSGMLAAMGMAVVSVGMGAAGAATLIPAKGYVKPGEDVIVRFLDETAQGKKAFEKIGFAAGELEGLFKAAPASEVAPDNKAAFALYTFDGKVVEAAKGASVAVKADGAVDLSAMYPQLKEAGTWVLVWKDACPIVIETLRNPMPWAVIMDESRVPVDKRPEVIKQVESEKPVVTHIVPLEYGVMTTGLGAIKVKFYYDVAPHTIDNFVSLANQKFYDGSNFHRIISGFMIQGGDSLANTARAGKGGPGYNVGAEFSDKPHVRGTLSMARSSIDAAGSQFFIVHQDSPHLNGLYTAFGSVIEGMKVVDAIADTPADHDTGAVTGTKPKIESVRIFPATAAMYGLGEKP